MRPERRRHPRIAPTTDWGLSCRTAGRSVSDYHLVTRVIDISAVGACIVTASRLRDGTPLTVEVVLPGGERCFKSPATVRWSTSVEADGRTAHVAGLHFDRVFRLAPREAEEAPDPRVRPTTPEPQRAHKRFSPDEVGIVCLPRGFLRALGLARNTGRRLKDLSRGGAQIVSSRRLKPGQKVDLRLEFRAPGVTVEAEGLIRWCRRDTSSLEPRYLAGVIFKRLPEGSERSLRAIERAFIGF